MSIVQWYARSIRSKSLQDDPTHHNTDVLAAVALSSKLGSSLYRVKYGLCRESVASLYVDWLVLIRKRAKRDNWERHAEEVAAQSLKHWAHDICQSCNGLGHPVIADTPTLSGETCQSCNGTGKTKPSCDPKILCYVLDAVNRLNDLVSNAARAAKKKLDT